MFSNRYIFIYTTVLVVAVAIVLSLAATLLQPMQTRNAEVAKMQEILNASGKVVSTEDAISVYNQDITSEMMVGLDGQVKACYVCKDGKWGLESGDASLSRAFNCNFTEEVTKAGKGENASLPVFVCEQGKIYILPLYGKGLWGPLWGYIAVKNDFNTIAGVTFGHKGETPGLGAEITTPNFQSMFRGKKLFDENGQFVSVTVQKGGAEKYAGDPVHAVDAISGGTITSNGVTAMLANCLKLYVPFFVNMKESGTLQVQDSLCVAVGDSVSFVQKESCNQKGEAASQGLLVQEELPQNQN